jgi:hypothetical protein
MRRFMVLPICTLLMSPVLADSADARPGYGGGGGFRGGGFARPAFVGGGGFRGGGFARPAFAGSGFRGGFAGPGFAGGGVRWAGGWRPGWGGWGHRPWRWRAAGLGFAFGALAAAPYYGGWYGGPYYDDCAPVPRQVWTGWGYRVVWVNTCDYY